MKTIRGRILQSVANLTARHPANRRNDMKRRSKPRLLLLEDRTVPSTFTVSNTLDSGAGSLRQAIIDANTQAGADTIVFDSIVFSNTIVVSSTLTITDPLLIDMPSWDSLKIQLNGVGSVFTIDKPGSAGMEVTIRGGAITGGTNSGIFLQDETLILDNSLVSGNSASRGGGIYVRDAAASLIVRSSTIENNSASSHGGGIYFFSGGSLLIENSTIAGNKSTGGAGGGIYFFGAAGGGTLTVRNSTISGNTSAQEGGGIALRTFSGTLQVQNSTITNNTASSIGGGGIARNAVSTGTISIESTIVSGNTNAISADIFSAGTVIVNFSAIGNANGFTLTGANNVPFGALLNLEPLDYYGYSGSPLKTHAIAYYHGSPCINAGSNPAGLATDQRGSLAQRVSGGAADIGAVEFQEFVVTNVNDSGPGSLRQALDNANALAGSRDFVKFDPAFFGTGYQAISLTSGALSISDPVSVYGPAYPGVLSVIGNKSARILNVSSKSVGGYGVYLYDFQIQNGAAEYGGGIRLENGFLGLFRVPVIGCTASVHGGGIFVTGNPDCSLRLFETTISGNAATVNGGGVYFYNGGYFTIERSTVNDNLATTGTGGGLYFYGSPTGGHLKIANSTFSGNISGNSGGGVFLNNFSGSLDVLNSTITKNTATSGLGGGLAMAAGSGTIGLTSTIVSGNTNATAPDISSPGKVLVDYCAVGNPSGFTLTGANNLPFGTDLKLGPLAYLSGPTPFHLPASDSPVINKGANPFGWPEDQTGLPRVVDLTADIGAVETAYLIVRNTNDSGAGSLRQAIADANAIEGINAITFDPAFFNVPRTIQLTSGELVITDELWILGYDVVSPTIDAKGSSRVLRIAVPNASQLILNNLTIQGGNAGNGGGIEVQTLAGLVLQNCTITGNTATGRGGGVYLAPGCFLSLDKSTVANNSAGVHGGGVYFFAGGQFSALQSTISGNQALGGAGGGVYFFGMANSPLYVVNSTISGNKALTEGGGLALRTFNGTLNLLNCTVTANHAFGSFGGVGGGISNNTATGLLNIESTIVSGNINGTVADVFSVGSVSLNYSAIGDSNGFSFTGGNNLPFGTTLFLGPLQNNGGPTHTHAFDFEVSPLLNAGSDGGYKIDQRGGDRVSGGQADIGAFEQQFFVVTNNNDSGLGSLREAIGRANALAPSADWVVFDPAFFATEETITLTTGEIQLTDSTTINGYVAPARVTVSGNNSSRVFKAMGNGAITVDLIGLTLTNGSAFSGGAIYCSGANLVITECTITGNNAGYGGGIYLEFPSATLTVMNSTISNNTAVQWGGGIENEGNHAIAIFNSTIAGNKADFGGGISNFGSAYLLIAGSTVSNNQAGNAGGGIRLTSGGGNPITIVNSTISGNKAGTFGGGISLSYVAGTVTVNNVTLTANSANKGGGIAQESSGLIALESTIISGDSASSAGPDLYTTGTVTAKTSLIGSISGVGVFSPDAVTTLLLGKAPLLGPLQNNGGLTQTHALLVGSPAINNGSNPDSLAWDQRDTSFKRSSGTGVDIGAFEMQAPPKVESVVIIDGATQRSRVTKVTVTFSTTVTLLANPIAQAFDLIRQSDGKSVDVTVNLSTSTPTQTIAVLTFNGALSDFGSLQDGRYKLTIPAMKVLDVSDQQLDGNGDGTGGDSYVLASSGSTGIFRLFGDANGDASVTAVDFNAFRMAYGTSGPSIFDFEGDNQVTGADFNQFRLRYGVTI